MPRVRSCRKSQRAHDRALHADHTRRQKALGRRREPRTSHPSPHACAARTSNRFGDSPRKSSARHRAASTSRVPLGRKQEKETHKEKSGEEDAETRMNPQHECIPQEGGRRCATHGLPIYPKSGLCIEGIENRKSAEARRWGRMGPPQNAKKKV